MDERHATIVIGGGQAGLAMSYHLQRIGREHLILERARIAARWHDERWDSLRFQFPNWSLQLPSQPYEGDDPHRFSTALKLPNLLRAMLNGYERPYVAAQKFFSLKPCQPEDIDSPRATDACMLRRS